MKKFWNWVRDADTQTRTLYLNGAIAEESWFEDDVTPAAFCYSQPKKSKS